jgi:predicted phosphodiesterase
MSFRTDDEIIAALREHGSNRKAAKALGLHLRTIERRRAALTAKGFSPEHGLDSPLPDGLRLKGISTLTRNNRGEPQWVKADRDADAMRAAMMAAVEAMAEPLRGLAKPVKAPARALESSLSSYIIGDHHFGMYAWAAEAGEDYDTAIAESLLRSAIDRLVAGAPASETAYLVDLGDLLHIDSRSNSTPESGNPLDVDSRYGRVTRVAVDALRYAIRRLLERHRKVKVFIVPGNHDRDSAGWISYVLDAYHHNEPRIEIERSPSKFYYQRFGKVLIGMTHGDKLKIGDLPSIMAADRPEDWGATRHRYWWTGHIHHTRHQEYRGCFVEAFNTLAASDAWHHASGYRSQRQMQRIDIDADSGIYSRGIAHIDTLKDKAA